jgi:hypothetical protein
MFEGEMWAYGRLSLPCEEEKTRLRISVEMVIKSAGL